MAQAAGRCNREGKKTASESVVTYFQGEHAIPLRQRVNICAAQEALKSNKDPGDPKTMDRYFSALRSLIGDNLDKSETIRTLREEMLPFETVAKGFHLIDQEAFTVYIPRDEGEKICRPLREKRAGREDYRRAGQYSVSVYERQFHELYDAGDIQLLSSDSAILANLELYDPQMGLSLKSDAGKAEFI